ncbi:MAG TPA: hypothetical protein VHG51_05965 [Longimicrobiaceae bacterium]|nr:hypothetical protein [Longimicrobiaceae bacterium]
MTSFQTYLLGFIILIVGLAAAAYLLGAPLVWIVVGTVVLIGIGILSATTRTKTRDPDPRNGRGGPPTGPGPDQTY